MQFKNIVSFNNLFAIYGPWLQDYFFLNKNIYFIYFYKARILSKIDKNIIIDIKRNKGKVRKQRIWSC